MPNQDLSRPGPAPASAAPDPATPARLEPAPGGGLALPALPLAARDLTLGCTPDCDLRLPDGGPVSRLQARLRWCGDRFPLGHEGGAYGTTVNGHALGVGEECALAQGDEIAFGGVRYRSTEAAGESAVPAADGE